MLLYIEGTRKCSFTQITYVCVVHTYCTYTKLIVLLFLVEGLPSYLTTGISNAKNGDVMYEPDSQSYNTAHGGIRASIPGICMYVNKLIYNSITLHT